MKYINLLPLAALTTAFVVPNEQVFNDLAVEADTRQARVVESASSTKDDVVAEFKSHYEQVTETVSDASKKGKQTYDDVADYLKDTSATLKDEATNALDDVLAFAHSVGSNIEDTAFDAHAWADERTDNAWDVLESLEEHEGPPHHGTKGPHGRPGKRPHHPPHHDKPNSTVYELIAESKYTTKLAKLINEFPDLVEALNGTKANYTVFAPTDRAFEKIPEGAPKPSKEQLFKLLSYHVSDDFYPAGRVLVTKTIPTLLQGDHLSTEPKPQRLSSNVGLRGLTVNFYSRIIAIDIFGTNGVIHGVDSLILPPPSVVKIIDLLPTEFSTLELGLGKTGLLEKLNTTDHPGGTLFAPSNFAFQKLGPKINAFLFSPYGQKYLKALLEYHVVPATTLYSDAIYQPSSDYSSSSSPLLSGPLSWLNRVSEHDCHKKSSMTAKASLRRRDQIDEEDAEREHHGPHHGPAPANIPKGTYHYTLPTFLEGKSLNVDIGRYGRLIGIRINGFARVVIEDGVADDGVIQVVGDVLIPPKTSSSYESIDEETTWGDKVRGWFGSAKDFVAGEGQMSVEEFKSRFEGLVDEE